MRHAIGFALSASLIVLGACGGSDTGNNNNGDGPDATPGHNGVCEQGGKASTDEYLPFAVGNLWRYNVTEEIGSPPLSKRQEVTKEMTPDGETEPVLVQMTTKSNGSTENWFRREGTALVRLRQMDYDPTGALERTTIYDPYKIRIDESPERTAAGAMWTETYTSIVLDPTGTELSRTEIMEQVTVVGTDVPCSTPWGELTCLQLHEERLVGGTAVKDFWFARGYGKVREDGQAQLEELSGCALQ